MTANLTRRQLLFGISAAALAAAVPALVVDHSTAYAAEWTKIDDGKWIVKFVRVPAGTIQRVQWVDFPEKASDEEVQL